MGRSTLTYLDGWCCFLDVDGVLLGSDGSGGGWKAGLGSGKAQGVRRYDVTDNTLLVLSVVVACGDGDLRHSVREP